MWGKAVQSQRETEELLGQKSHELAEVFRVDASKYHEDAHPPRSVDPAEPAKPSWSPSCAYQRRDAPAVGRVNGISPNAYAW